MTRAARRRPATRSTWPRRRPVRGAPRSPSGTFGVDDRGALVDLPLGAPIPNVGAIKYVMLSPQVPDWSGCPFDYGGCTYMDTTEVAVYDD